MLLADGYDRDSVHKARSRLRLAWWSGSGIETAVLDRSQGDIEVSRLLDPDIDGDGKDEFLTATNTRLRVVERGGDGWIAWDAPSSLVDAAVLSGGASLTVAAKPELIARTR